MAFVSVARYGFFDSTVSFSQAVSAGDVLLVVFTARRFSVDSGEATLDRLQVPEGWQRVGQIWDGRASGRPTQKDMAAMVAWHRVSASGTVSATFTWPGGVTIGADAHVLRYSGMRGVRGIAWARSSWGVEFPAVSLPEGQVASPAGHAVRIAVTGRTPTIHEAYPPGHVKRVQQVLYSGWIPLYQRYEDYGVVVSDQSLSNATPGQVRAYVTAGTSWGVTLYLASTHGPKAPTLDLSPGIHDLSAAWTLGWTPDGAQTGVRVTRQALDANGQPTGSVEYLSSVSSPAWTTTATTITTAATSVAFPAGHWPAAGARYRITVATVGGAEAPDLGDTASVDVESWQGPTVSSVTLNPASGGVIGTRLPMVTVSGTAGSGSTISAWQAEVFDADTGQVYAAHRWGWIPSWTVTVDQAIPNGATVRARGRVLQRGVQWSDWVESPTYTVNAPRPATPTATVAHITHPVSGLPGLAVTVVSVAGRVTLYRNGVLLDSWVSTGSLTIADYTLPTDTPVSYTATVTVGSPLPEESLPSAPVTSTLDPSLLDSWLVDPLNPADAVRVPRIDFTEKIGHPSTVHYPLTAGEIVQPIVQSLTPHTPSGTITFSIETHAQEAAIIRMLTSSRPLIYNRWPEYTYNPLCEVSVLRPLRFIPVGEITITHMKGHLQWRDISVGWVEQR